VLRAWAIALVLAGCAPAEVRSLEPKTGAAPTAVAAPLPAPGERLRATARSRGLTIGELEIAVGAPCVSDGRDVVPVSSTAAHVGLYGMVEPWRGEIRSLLDAATGRPFTTHSRTENDTVVGDVAVSFGGDGFRSRWERRRLDGRRGLRPIDRTRALPGFQPGHDLHSALTLLRGWAGEPGTRGVIHVVVGVGLWRLEVHVAATEPFVHDGAAVEAARIEGVARRMSRRLEPSRRARPFALWVSTSAERLPLGARFETRDGTVDVELEERALETPLGAGMRCPGT
jgi:hypothetical protein